MPRVWAVVRVGATAWFDSGIVYPVRRVWQRK